MPRPSRAECDSAKKQNKRVQQAPAQAAASVGSVGSGEEDEKGEVRGEA
jgi:hypothetical protein